MTVTIGGFSLLGTDDEETRLVVHRDSGFAMSLPGHVRAREPGAAAPRADIVLALADLRIEISLHMQADERAAFGEPQAIMVATSFASERAAAEPSLTRVVATRGAGAVISAHYYLRDGADDGADDAMEHLAVSTAVTDDGPFVLVQTCRYRRAELTPPEWANFIGAVMAAQSWIESKRPAMELYPASELALPAAKLTPTPTAWAIARAARTELAALPAQERAAVRALILGFPHTDDPPPHPIAPATLDLVAVHVRSVSERVAAVILRDLPRARTTHDFRAWCWLAAWMLAPDES